MKKLKKINAACAVVALCYASQVDEETVLRICKSCGFEEGQGMADNEWGSAAKHLGLKTRAVLIEQCDLKSFIKNHPKGLYLVGTWDHLFALDNGVLYDPMHPRPPGLRRIVKQAWRVER